MKKIILLFLLISFKGYSQTELCGTSSMDSDISVNLYQGQSILAVKQVCLDMSHSFSYLCNTVVGDSGIAGGYAWSVTPTKPRIGYVDTTKGVGSAKVATQYYVLHNLGAYLPLAGGNMSGIIYGSSGNKSLLDLNYNFGDGNLLLSNKLENQDEGYLEMIWHSTNHSITLGESSYNSLTINKAATGHGGLWRDSNSISLQTVAGNFFLIGNIPTAGGSDSLLSRNSTTGKITAIAKSSVGSGTVTSVATSYGLTGGTITTTGTLKIDTTQGNPFGSRPSTQYQWYNYLYNTFSGSAHIVTLGTIATGTWNGSLISPTYGGTGVNNGSNTLTWASSLNFGSSTKGYAYNHGNGIFTYDTIRVGSGTVTSVATGRGLLGGTITTSGTIKPDTSKATGLSTRFHADSIAAAQQAYTNAAVAASNPSTSVQAATTTALPAVTCNNGASGIGATLTQNSAAILTIDGYTPALNDRLLIKNQATTSQNGVYIITTLGTSLIPFVLTRATDFDQPNDINNSGSIAIQNGGQAGQLWICNSIISSVNCSGAGTAITFTQLSAAIGATVQSVVLNTPNVIFGTPVNYVTSASTATGTLSLNTQSAHTALMGPTGGSAATPTFRQPYAKDISGITDSNAAVNSVSGSGGITTNTTTGAVTVTFTGHTVTDSLGSDSNSLYINCFSGLNEVDTVYKAASGTNDGQHGVVQTVSFNNFIDKGKATIWYRKLTTKYSQWTFPANHILIAGTSHITISNNVVIFPLTSGTSIFKIVVEKVNDMYNVSITKWKD